jgi:hypothetical protein
MTALPLFTLPRGDTFDLERDGARLGEQQRAVFTLMRDGRWRTLADIRLATGYPEASISARLRECGRLKGWRKEREYVAGGLHRYRVVEVGR